MGKIKKMVLGGLVLIFASFFVGAAMSSPTDDRTKQIQNEEQITAEDMQKQREFLDQYEFPQYNEDYKKQEATSIQKSKGLPTSCNGVDSTETWLYPTGEKCMKELGQGYHAWCLSETKGDKAKTDLCVIDVASRLIQLCKDPVLSSPEVCLMYNMKYIYQEMMSQ